MSPALAGPWAVFLGCGLEKSEPVSWFSGEADHILPTSVCLVPFSDSPNLDIPSFSPFVLLSVTSPDTCRAASGGQGPWYAWEAPGAVLWLRNPISPRRRGALSYTPSAGQYTCQAGWDESLPTLCCHPGSTQRPCVQLLCIVFLSIP